MRDRGRELVLALVLRKHYIRDFLQVGHRPLFPQPSQNLVGVPFIGEDLHLHRPPAVRRLEPFGQPTQLPLHVLPIFRVDLPTPRVNPQGHRRLQEQNDVRKSGRG